MKTVLTLFILASLCLSATFAIRCYQCTSFDAGCKDEFTATNMINEDCTACSKSKVLVGEIHTVTRGCTNLKSDDCHEVDTSGVETSLCTCTTDLCNHGNTVKMHMTKAMMLVVLVWMMKHFYQ